MTRKEGKPKYLEGNDIPKIASQGNSQILGQFVYKGSLFITELFKIGNSWK